MPVGEFSHLFKARQLFRFRIGILPRYDVATDSGHNGDTGHGHEVTFYDIPILGPNRIGVVGEAIEFDGSASYARIGDDDPTGHHWYVYQSDSEIHGSGTLVYDVAGETMSWTPTEDGIFRVELHLGHRASGGETDGMRFVRVFDGPYDSDLSKAISLSGSASVDNGGYEITITHKPLGAGSVTEVPEWARIVVDVQAYYSNFLPIDDADLYNYQTDEELDTGNPASASVQFDGIVVQTNVNEDGTSETMTFRATSPSLTLKRVPLFGYKKTLDVPTSSGIKHLPAEYPLFFGDPDEDIDLPDGSSINVVEYIRQNDPDFPVHEISDMRYADPIIHLLQRHTNFMQWNDVMIEQDNDRHKYPYATGEGDVYSQLKKFQDMRMGVLYSNKKGRLFFARDVMFQDDIWWSDHHPRPMFTIKRDYLTDIQVEEIPRRVAQVQLTGVNDKNEPFAAWFPSEPDTVGQIVKRTNLRPYSSSKLTTWASRLYFLMNRPNDVTAEIVGIDRFFELEDVLGIEYTDRADTVTLD